MNSIPVGSTSSSSLMSKKKFLHSGAECWVMAEKTAQEILSVLQPTVVSDQKRLEIVNYIRELIRDIVGNDVLAFGSTPLRTYLPDGDIDLTVLTSQTDVGCLASSVYSILEELSFGGSPIRDVQFVNAQVKIVKCLVQQIRVDISFNQVAGLNALCFLEQAHIGNFTTRCSTRYRKLREKFLQTGVILDSNMDYLSPTKKTAMDQYIGRVHLFKRSIILIKAWCFYESRLLGSHCSLMSTYALEVLILHIINLFHSSLSGPLAVLYKFLDYYSTFEWDRFCISVYGPVDINFLPKVVETSATTGTRLLLSKNFLESCIKSFSTSKRVFETERQQFPKKHLNIIDPLKGKNNLGRSISQGNFHRIKFAFSYGCQKLRDALELPLENMRDGVMAFFVNTCEWSGRLKMHDAGVSADDSESRILALKGGYNCPIECLNYARWHINSCVLRLPTLQMSPSRIQSQNIEDEFAQNVYFPGDADYFVSSSLVHPNGFQLLDSVLNVDETEKYLGEGTYVSSASSEGKFKLNASAPPFISSAVREKVKCEGTGLFIPQVDIERKPKSKETDLCLPYAQCNIWGINFSQKERNSAGSSLKPSIRNQLADVPFEADRVRGSSSYDLSREECRLDLSDNDGESSCFDLSLVDFPLLPSSKKPFQAAKHNWIQLTKDSPWAGKLSNWQGSSVAVPVMSLPGDKEAAGSGFGLSAG